MVSQNFELPISAFKPSRNVLYVVFKYNEISFHFILFVKLTWSKWTHWPFGSLCVWKCMWFWVTICHLCEFLPLFHGLSNLTIHIQRQRWNTSGRDQFKAFYDLGYSVFCEERIGGRSANVTEPQSYVTLTHRYSTAP